MSGYAVVSIEDAVQGQILAAVVACSEDSDEVTNQPVSESFSPSVG